MTRNSEFASWKGSNWNEAFLGSVNAPENHCEEDGGPNAYTTVDKTPLIAEKPYISENNGNFTLNVPRVEKDKVGVTKDFKNADQRDFSDVFVANENSTAKEITSKINEGLDIVLQPGIYHLYDTIKV